MGSLCGTLLRKNNNLEEKEAYLVILESVLMWNFNKDLEQKRTFNFVKKHLFQT